MEMWALVLFLKVGIKTGIQTETFAGPATIQGIVSEEECEKARDTVRRAHRAVAFCVPYMGRVTNYVIAE